MYSAVSKLCAVRRRLLARAALEASALSLAAFALALLAFLLLGNIALALLGTLRLRLLLQVQALRPLLGALLLFLGS